MKNRFRSLITKVGAALILVTPLASCDNIPSEIYRDVYSDLQSSRKENNDLKQELVNSKMISQYLGGLSVAVNKVLKLTSGIKSYGMDEPYTIDNRFSLDEKEFVLKVENSFDDDSFEFAVSATIPSSETFEYNFKLNYNFVEGLDKSCLSLDICLEDKNNPIKSHYCRNYILGDSGKIEIDTKEVYPVEDYLIKIFMEADRIRQSPKKKK